MTGRSRIADGSRVDSFAIIANAHSRLALVIAKLYFDLGRLSLARCLALGFISNLVDLSLQPRTDKAQLWLSGARCWDGILSVSHALRASIRWSVRPNGHGER